MSYDPTITELLRFDPLYFVEGLTGKSYKEDPETERDGMLLHITHTRRKNEILRSIGDSHLGISWVEYAKLLMNYGFRIVLTETFVPPTHNPTEVPPKEYYLVLWHPKGILATVESYYGKSLNSSKVYYNIAFTEYACMGIDDRWPFTSSGSFAWEVDFDAEPHKGFGRLRDVDIYPRKSEAWGFTGVWVGDHDGREGIINALEGLQTVGEFLPEWIQQPFLWLVHYGEFRTIERDASISSHKRGDVLEQLSQARIAKLPLHVQDAIRGEEGYC